MKTLLQKSKPVLIFRGIIAILLGIFLIVFPMFSLVAFAFIAGAAAFLYGVYAIISSISLRNDNSDWWVILVEGILGVLLGILVICFPLASLAIPGLFLGCWIMAIGLLTIFQAIELRKEIEGEGWYILAGILAVILGILLISMPVFTAGIMMYIFAFLLIVYGIFLFFAINKINKVQKAHETKEEQEEQEEQETKEE